jgi:hypothetical protein
MARNFLAIPGSSLSVSVALFLQTYVHTRSSMMAHTISNIVLAKQWISKGLLVTK